MEDLTGKQLGPYQVVAPLGEGGMAAVYKAYQPAMDRYVALKILPRHFASDPEFVARFQREARLLARLQHPHILPVFDFGQADGYTYLVMPFIESGTLTDLITGQPLPLPLIRRVISQVGDALAYAHAHGLIHRDVKPSNVLLDESGNCLLSDFGLARMAEGSLKLTVSGAILGTPAYMSPEQGAGQPIDHRSDIYSLGIILYELITGRVPYRAETPVAVIFKHIQDPLPPTREVSPDLPDALERVVLKSLAKHADDRFQSARELVAALQAAIPESGERLPPTEAAPPTWALPGAPAAEPPGSLAPASPPPLSAPPLAAPPVWRRPAVIVGAVVLLGAMALVIGALLRPPVAEATPSAPAAAQLLATPSPAPATATPSPEPTTSPTPRPEPATATPSPEPTAIPHGLVLPTAAAAFTGRIAFVSYRDRDEEIYSMYADGSQQTRLTFSRNADNEPTFSPDGGRIAFVSQRAGGHKLFIMNSDGSDQRQLTDNRSTEEYNPHFSPDGQWIVYSSSRGGRYELWLIRPDGSDLRQLTTGPNGKNLPAWSPDGQWIAYNSVEDGSDVIKVIRPDGSDDRVLLRRAEAYVSGWVGSRILFTARTDTTTDIYSMAPDGSDLRQLTSHPANDRGPSGTPDGQFIIFNSARDGDDNIYVMRADGSGATRLTIDPGNDYMPTWTGVLSAAAAPTRSAQTPAASACAAVTGPFASAWADSLSRIGCALDAAAAGSIVEEAFQNGRMFWRESVDRTQILVAYSDGTWKIYSHVPFVEGSPEFACPDASTPSESPPTPRRGFGAVWCDTREVRSRLGNAVNAERGYVGDLQTFERGFGLRNDLGQIFLFFSDGGWVGY